MSEREDPQHDEKLFTLSEANCLIPQLEQLWSAIHHSRMVLLRTREEIKKASAKAHLGGGSVAGPRFIQALQQINECLHTMHEFGVIVKDLELGLCDFPYVLNGRTVYLCWKAGEEKIQWWHETHGGYTGRQALPEDAY